jgi:hypothetical protein
MRTLERKQIKAKEVVEGVWLVGFLFEGRRMGEDTIGSLVDLYNSFDEREKEKTIDGNEAGIAK